MSHISSRRWADLFLIILRGEHRPNANDTFERAIIEKEKKIILSTADDVSP